MNIDIVATWPHPFIRQLIATRDYVFNYVFNYMSDSTSEMKISQTCTYL